LATLAGIGPKLVRASDVTVVTLTLGHDYATIFERLRSQRLE